MELAGGQLDIPLGTTVEELTEIINKLLNNEEKLPYSFSFENLEVSSFLCLSIFFLDQKKSQGNSQEAH